MRGISNRKRDAVFARHPVCCYCRQPYGEHERRPTVDHLVPRFRGGSHGLENLVGCCSACNVAKGCRTPQEWLIELADAVRMLEAMQGGSLVTTGGLT
jgi:5-methylcytosine-specific restriction endonuclease McrA